MNSFGFCYQNRLSKIKKGKPKPFIWEGRWGKLGNAYESISFPLVERDQYIICPL
jgi:hypothetical protein